MDNHANSGGGGVCSDLKADIPMSPLYHMGKAAKFESKDSLNAMQKAIDYLACKAKNKQPLDKDEKEFLKELFEAFWWGGKFKGWKEAAQLARHYVHGNGKALAIDAEMYQSSVIVKDSMRLMKKYIAELIQLNKPYQHVSSGDVGFYTQSYSKMLTKGMRNYQSHGQMRNGLLIAEQSNERLQKSDNRFYLECINSKLGDKKVFTKWYVVNIYDFQPFEKADFITDIALKRPEFVLKVPDGLSYHMSKIGIAKEFEYRSEWSETWEIR